MKGFIKGKQLRYCPNCGREMYDDIVINCNVKAMMCCDACVQEWATKYARSILGKDQFQ